MNAEYTEDDGHDDYRKIRERCFQAPPRRANQRRHGRRGARAYGGIREEATLNC